MALVALPAVSFAGPLDDALKSREQSDSILVMRERLKIANELLRTVSGILGESEDAVGRGLLDGRLSRKQDFPTFRPDGSRQDSIGEFVWLPDTLLAEWNEFVEMKRSNLKLPVSPGLRCDSLTAVSADGFEPVSPFDSSYVTFRGDTIPRVLKERKFGRYDRGLFNYLYIPKGLWSFGLTASYGELNTKDIEMFDLITGVTLRGDIFSISPYMQYFIKNNLAVGLKLSYTRGSASVNSFNLEIDEDMAFNINDINYKTENYESAFTLRQYFGLDRSARFGVFNEIELAFASGMSDFNRPYDGEMRRLHSTTMQAQLNFSPGVSVFIMKNVGFNVSFGVFGFSLKNEKQYLNDVYQGSRFTSGANFRFNIFNINFGLAVTL